MGDRMTCPGCSARLSSVLAAFLAERPCPECGLSYEAAAEILAIRQKGADAELAERLEGALKELGQANAELGKLRYRLTRVEAALQEVPPDWD